MNSNSEDNFYFKDFEDIVTFYEIMVTKKTSVFTILHRLS